MTKNKMRVLALSLSFIMILSAVPFTTAYAEEATTLDITCPFRRDVSFSLNGQPTQSNSYRIPALVTLSDGTIVAASDIRWNTTYDGGGLDTLTARSSDGGATWEYTVANYLGDNGNEYNGSLSTSFIDPCLTVGADGQTIYMLCDIYPYGVALNGSGNTQPKTDSGFTEDNYLKLSDNDHSSYDYYLKDGHIYDSEDNIVEGYTVDAYFNLYQNDVEISNIFYADSPFKVVRTGYLYLTSSSDAGKTWSEPRLLNLKKKKELVCLVGPGRGLTTSDGMIIFPVYNYKGSSESQTMGFIYSTDDGNTWTRVQSEVKWSSESAVVEIATGVLRFFYRNGKSVLSYVDYDMYSGSWSEAVKTDIATNSNTQISAIKYSKTTEDGQIILVSCPAGADEKGSNQSGASYRLNGRIFTFCVAEDGSMTLVNTVNVNDGQFMYSCLTERSDGSVAILYEDGENAWGAGDNCYYTMSMKSYSPSELGISSKATLTIKVNTADESPNGNTAFLFDVTGDGIEGKMTFAVYADTPITITGLKTGCEYTITCRSDWSWKYSLKSWEFNGETGSENTATVVFEEETNTLVFEYTFENDELLSDEAKTVTMCN